VIKVLLILSNVVSTEVSISKSNHWDNIRQIRSEYELFNNFLIYTNSKKERSTIPCNVYCADPDKHECYIYMCLDDVITGSRHNWKLQGKNVTHMFNTHGKLYWFDDNGINMFHIKFLKHYIYPFLVKIYIKDYAGWINVIIDGKIYTNKPPDWSPHLNDLMLNSQKASKNLIVYFVLKQLTHDVCLIILDIINNRL
jgi:hypothetical protein